MPACVQDRQFTQFLVTQTPVYDELIIRDIRPEDGWIGHIETGQWEPFSNTTHVFDRFRQVMPNVTKPWTDMPVGSCMGAPCDPDENCIGWGWDRVTYGLERQSWVTDLLCFDQILTVTRAKEHFAQIVEDILRPATSRIMSFYLRKRAADNAKFKWVADATMTNFTYTWSVVGNDEIYMTPTAVPTSKLTPQMLQRRIGRLMFEGYFGKQPFKDMPPLVELVTDYNTLWDLDKAAVDSNVNDKWRFQEWEAANKFYKYAFNGQLGQYVTRVDPFIIRFNLSPDPAHSPIRMQVVLPYRNVAATQGIGSEYNIDFENAQYQWSHIWHRRAGMVLVARTESVNPLMPFANRSLGGQWQFVMDNLGADCNGVPIENKRRNKGQFLADFVLSYKPQYTEFSELIFHKCEPAYIVTIDTCAADPGYPFQYYDSCNDRCEGANISFTPVQDGSGNYVIAANTITCEGVAQVVTAISEATLPDLVNALNTQASALGVWLLEGTLVILTESTCAGEVVVPFVV